MLRAIDRRTCSFSPSCLSVRQSVRLTRRPLPSGLGWKWERFRGRAPAHHHQLLAVTVTVTFTTTILCRSISHACVANDSSSPCWRRSCWTDRSKSVCVLCAKTKLPVLAADWTLAQAATYQQLESWHLHTHTHCVCYYWFIFVFIVQQYNIVIISLYAVLRQKEREFKIFSSWSFQILDNT